MTKEEAHRSSSPSVLAPASPPSRKGHHPGRLYWAPATASPYTPPPPSTDSCALGKPLEQTPVGWPHAQMELKAQLAPGLRKKSWNLSSQLHKQCLYTHNRLCNLSPLRASEWKSRPHPPHPVTTGLALAAVDFVGSYMRGLGQARAWAARTAPQRVQLHDEYDPGPWFQWIYAGDVVKTTSERPQGHVPAYPGLRWGQKQCQHRVTWDSHNVQKVTHRAHPEVNIPRGAILSGFSPSGCAPIPPASTIDQKQSEETDLGTLFHQPGSRLRP